MCAIHSHPSKKPSDPFYQAIKKIHSHLHHLIEKMEKESHYTPERKDLEAQAEHLIDFLNVYHEKAKPHKSHLKAAIIDLTEIPQMSHQMQRIAFLTALKDASIEIDRFLHCY